MRSDKVLGLAARITVMAIVLSVILLFAGIGLLVLIHACIVRRSFRSGFVITAAVDRGSTSMSQDDLDKLPCYDYTTRDKGSSPVDCAVCLDNFKAGEKCRLLPICKHSFHAQCVDAWLLKTPICPICRTSADSRTAGSESSRFNDTSTELTDSQGAGSDRFNGIGIEVRQSQTTGMGQWIGIIIESEQSQSESNGAGTTSSEENQTNLDGTLTPLRSDSLLLLADSASEPAV